MDHGIYHFIYICLVNKKYCIFTRKHNKFYIVTLTNKLSNWYKEINKIRTHMNGKLLLKKKCCVWGREKTKTDVKKSIKPQRAYWTYPSGNRTDGEKINIKCTDAWIFIVKTVIYFNLTTNTQAHTNNNTRMNKQKNARKMWSSKWNHIEMACNQNDFAVGSFKIRREKNH